MIIKVVNLTRALYFKCSETITIPLCKDQTEMFMPVQNSSQHLNHFIQFTDCVSQKLEIIEPSPPMVSAINLAHDDLRNK